jgi:hypothetical protein
VLGERGQEEARQGQGLGLGLGLGLGQPRQCRPPACAATAHLREQLGQVRLQLGLELGDVLGADVDVVQRHRLLLAKGAGRAAAATHCALLDARQRMPSLRRMKSTSSTMLLVGAPAVGGGLVAGV